MLAAMVWMMVFSFLRVLSGDPERYGAGTSRIFAIYEFF